MMKVTLFTYSQGHIQRIFNGQIRQVFSCSRSWVLNRLLSMGMQLVV